MAHEKGKTGYNNEVVNRLSREQFIAQHPHMPDEAGGKWDESHKADEKPKKTEK